MPKIRVVIVALCIPTKDGSSQRCDSPQLDPCQQPDRPSQARPQHRPRHRVHGGGGDLPRGRDGGATLAVAVLDVLDHSLALVLEEM